MPESSGYIEVDLFPKEVNTLDHPKVLRFRELLEDVAMQYRCRLTYFEVLKGTVVFSFDSEVLMADIIKILQDDSQNQA